LLASSDNLSTTSSRTKAGERRARIALIVGSVRENRQGIKVARWMEGKLKSRDHTVYFIDHLLNLPLLNKMYKEMPNPLSATRPTIKTNN
jgi:NAD(P)H-dependent FMN reductase